MGHIGKVDKLGRVVIPSSMRKNYDIDKPITICTLYFDELCELADFNKKYNEVSKFPSVERDLSLVIKKEFKVDEIKKIITENSGKLLKHLDLYDIYEGSQLPDGFKSVTYNLLFSSLDHTLVDDEVDSIINKIISKLNEIGVEIRK